MFKKGELQDFRQKGCAVTALAMLGGILGALALVGTLAVNLVA